MHELKVQFLGTGSARPTPRRNVACIALSYGGDSLLFDCGEGSQTQAMQAGLRTSRLRGIFITHFHGDHINGLPGFLGTMGLNGHREPLLLAAPRGMKRYFGVLRDLSILHPSFPVIHVENTEPVVFEGDGFEVRTVELDHRIPARGFLFVERDLPGRFDLARAKEIGVPAGPLFGRLQRGESIEVDGRVVSPQEVLGPTRRGRRVAYISDTRPTREVVEFVSGADLLIHEGTYSHEFHGQAVERGHSTVREAAEVAKRAGVKQLIITHISTKHNDTRPLVREARAVFKNTTIARDFDDFEVAVPE